jgi:hypothetical protein
MESHHDLISLFEHDLRANASRVCREGKPVSTFPDHAPRGDEQWHKEEARLIAQPGFPTR